MTRNDIVVSALSQLGRGQDAQSIETYSDRLASYANDAIIDLAGAYKPTRTDTAVAANGAIDLAMLPRNCVKVIEVLREGGKVPFSAGKRSGEVAVTVSGEVDVTYRFTPMPLRSTTDEPELPEYMHGLIVSYVVARERAATDASNQRGANIYFELYEAGKRGIRSHVGEAGAYSIVNRWD